MSLLCAGSPPPSAFIVSARFCVSNAALFHACACAACGTSKPAPPRSESSVTPLPVFKRFLRFRFIEFSPKFQAAFYAIIAETEGPSEPWPWHPALVTHQSIAHRGGDVSLADECNLPVRRHADIDRDEKRQQDEREHEVEKEGRKAGDRLHQTVHVMLLVSSPEGASAACNYRSDPLK